MKLHTVLMSAPGECLYFRPNIPVQTKNSWRESADKQPRQHVGRFMSPRSDSPLGIGRSRPPPFYWHPVWTETLTPIAYSGLQAHILLTLATADVDASVAWGLVVGTTAVSMRGTICKCADARDQEVFVPLSITPDHFKEADHEQQLLLLENLPENERIALLEQLDNSAHRYLTGPDDHPKGTSIRPIQFDWCEWKEPKSEYNTMSAWAFSTLATSIYAREDATHSSHDGFNSLIRSGFSVQMIGEDTTPESVQYGGEREPRLATPFLLSARDDMAIVAIRGSQSKRSFHHNRNFFMTADPNFMDGKLHAGFLACAQEIWTELEPALMQLLSLQRSASAQLRLYLTGHSLGGAMAALLAKRAQSLPNLRVESVYAFGMPMAVNREGAKSFEACGLAEKTWRLENHHDPVVRLPKSFITNDYVHFGQVVYMAANARIYHGMSMEEVKDAVRKGHNDQAPKRLKAHSALAYTRKLFLAKPEHHNRLGND